MNAIDSVGIVGVGQTAYGRRRDVNTSDLASEAVRLALQDAQLTFDDVDAVFIGTAPDALIGVSDPDQWLVADIGAVGKPMMRISTGGSTGASAAAAAFNSINSGVFDVVVAVAVERATESSDVQALMNTNFDPIFERGIGMNAINTYALVGVDHMVRYGTTEEQLATISVRNHQNALSNPLAHLKLDITLDDVMQSEQLCWPVKLLDTCPSSDGACATVLISRRASRRASPRVAWFRGLASYSDGYFLGDREVLSYREHLVMAAQSAYEQAGITDPVRDLDVAELQNPFTVSELVGMEALAFCGIGEAGQALDDGLGNMDSSLPINPSGGALSSNPVGATSLVRIAEVALQVTDKAGDRQVPGASLGLAQCSGGSVQFGFVAILGGT